MKIPKLILVITFLIGCNISLGITYMFYPTNLDYEITKIQRGIGAGDFDLDMDLDLVVTNKNSIAILYNNGDATFNKPVCYDIPSYPVDLLTCDLNDDSQTDIITCVEHINENIPVAKLVFFLNKNGAFNKKILDIGYFTPIRITCGDFDQDSDLDFVINTDLHYSYIIFNQGDFNFSKVKVIFTWKILKGLTSGDFDNDNDLDVAIVEQRDERLFILFNDGSGKFPNHSMYRLGIYPEDVISVDIDGDNDLDLAASNVMGGDVYVFSNNGRGEFNDVISYVVGGEPRRLAFMDYDQDSDMDILVSNNGYVSILRNKGNGLFESPVNWYGPNGAGGIVVNDFNSDNLIDFATSDFDYNTVKVMINKGDNSFFGASFFGHENRTKDIVSGDFDLDSDLDIIVTNFDTHTVSVLKNDGKGNFNEIIDYETGLEPCCLSKGDFNQDNYIDFIVLSSGSPYLSIFFNRGDGTFEFHKNYYVERYSNVMAAGDIDSDSDLDLVVMNPRMDVYYLFFNDGTGEFLNFKVFYLDFGSYEETSVVLEDFNLDNNLDMAFAASPKDYGLSLVVLFGNGDGTFGPPINYITINEILDIYPVDIDLDSDIDLLCPVNNVGLFNRYYFFYLFKNLGDGSFNIDLISNIIIEAKGISSGDFDQDYDIDIALLNKNANNVTVLFNNCSGNFYKNFYYNFGTYGAEKIISGDFNGDGKIDLAISGIGVSLLFNNFDSNSPKINLNLEMPSKEYHPGDIFWLKENIVNNSEINFIDSKLFVILDIGIGEYWFYPGWKHFPPEYDFKAIDILSRETKTIEVINELSIPYGIGTYENCHFWSVVTDYCLNKMISNIEQISFSIYE